MLLQGQPMISDADISAVFATQPRRGNISGCDWPPHHSSAIPFLGQKVTHTAGLPLKSVGGRVEVSLIPRVCHRVQLAAAGLESTLIARAYAVIAPSFYRLPLLRSRGICT